MAQPLRSQIFFSVAILTILVYLAIGYGARLTYDEHVRQLAAETGTMAATVVVYVNRNLETADAVAATASRHPGMRALDPNAAAEVLLPLLDGRDQLLHNALITDREGAPVAWARPPDPKVEGLLPPSFLKSVATTGKTLVSSMLGQAGDDQLRATPCTRSSWAIRSSTTTRSSERSACRCISRRSSVCWHRFRCPQVR